MPFKTIETKAKHDKSKIKTKGGKWETNVNEDQIKVSIKCILTSSSD